VLVSRLIYLPPAWACWIVHITRCDLIRERTRDGLAADTARSRNGGRKQRLTEGQKATARKLRADGHSIRAIGQLLSNGKPVSRQTVYRALGMLMPPHGRGQVVMTAAPDKVSRSTQSSMPPPMRNGCLVWTGRS
jgi:hypothetical protein